MVATSAIDVIGGFNPRKFFDRDAFVTFRESVRKRGLIQSIAIRPVGERYALIAGERRLRAALEVGLAEVPCRIFDVDAAEAKVIAMIENTEREDMAPSEEARAARDVLADCEGDKQEACRHLNWQPAKLDARLLLLHCAEPVLQALDAKQIKLGHAELLAQLPEKTQLGTLAAVRREGISVAVLRERIQGFARPLAKAIFDLAECRGCPFNSSQYDLFGESIGDSRCSNRECWKAKTDDALAQRKRDLQAEYARVALDTEVDPKAVTTVLESAVGRAQFLTGCKGCGDFGVMLISKPGREGELQRDCCFNLGCHAQLVKARQADPAAKPVAATSGKKGKAAATAKVARASVSPKLSAWVDEFLKSLARAPATEQAPIWRAISLHLAEQSLGAASDLAKRLDDLAGLDEQQWQQRMRDVAARYVAKDPTTASLTPDVAVAVLRVAGTDVQAAFKPDAAFCQAQDKNTLEATLRELAFDRWYRQHKPKPKSGDAFKSLIGKKREVIEQTVCESRFDWSAKMPSFIAKRLTKAK